MAPAKRLAICCRTVSDNDPNDEQPDPRSLPATLVARLRALEERLLEAYDHFIVATVADAAMAHRESGSAEWPPAREWLDERLSEALLLAGETLMAGAYLRHGIASPDVWQHVLDDAETAIIKGRHRSFRVDSRPWEG